MTEKTTNNNFCLGGCGVTTGRLSGYCTVCEPEVDATQYDTMAEGGDLSEK